MTDLDSFLKLTAKQFRRAANLQDKIQSLTSELAKILGTSITSDAGGTPKKKRRMSAAGRARIAAAARKRWRLAKAAGKTTL